MNKPKKEAVAGTTDILETNIRLLEARKKRAMTLIGNPQANPAFEAALKSVDCSIHSLKQQLEEQLHHQPCAETHS
ncbi:hypothetical protein ACQKFM_29085 [Paenibacillus xylanexedens]|uniref:hypothetical protein n=1 Tax=Paenibacillus xylanexedens TaxID=528191 RepID=UPI003D08CCC8